MATAVELLQQRAQEDWLALVSPPHKPRDPHEPREPNDSDPRPPLTAADLATAALQAQDWLAQQPWNGHRPGGGDRPLVLLAIAEPAPFLAWFSALTSLGYPLFLGNPAWARPQWQQIAQGLAPDVIIASLDPAIAQGLSWDRLPVENLRKQWKTQDFPQIYKPCGKRADALSSKALTGMSPSLGIPQPVKSGWIGIPTGGSSGQLRFAIHSWNSLCASVSGLRASALVGAEGPIHSCCTLPLYHVSGLMQFLRSLLSGGQFVLLPWQTIQCNFLSPKSGSTEHKSPLKFDQNVWDFEPDKFFLSLVPTQLQRLLQQPTACQWLVRFRTVFLGGAPAWPAVLAQARAASIRLAPTYGLTETASQVVTLSPADFLRGQTGCGKLLPHAQIRLETPGGDRDKIEAQKAPPPVDSGEWPPRDGTPRPNPKLGVLRIWSSALALGYYSIAAGPSGAIAQVTLWTEAPAEQSGEEQQQGAQQGGPEAAQWPSGPSLLTDDLGYFDDRGYLHLVGRTSDKIISGGENVFPAAVEGAILALEAVQDALVLGLPDGDWGERVVAVVVAPGSSAAELAAAIAPQLPPPQRPKQWLLTDALPRNAQGKIARSQLRDWAMAQLPAEQHPESLGERL